MVTSDRDRGISTVMDVSLALLLISACVLLLGVHVHSDDDSVDHDRADRTYQTLSGSTVTITYDMTAANQSGHAPIDSDQFDIPDGLEPAENPALYRVTTYDAASALLAEAALVNVEVNGTQPLAYGDDVERSVDAAVQGQLVGADDSIYAVATWEPYENSSIRGTATTGERPPRTADVSSASATVSTTMTSADYEEIAAEFYDERESSGDGVDGAARAIAAVIVEAMFPVAETQYTLESTLTENSVTKYDYRRLALAVGDDDLRDDVNDDITGTSPNAEAANAKLADALTERIADDMRDHPVADDLNQTHANYRHKDRFTDEAAPLLEDYVSVETVDLTVQVTE